MESLEELMGANAELTEDQYKTILVDVIEAARQVRIGRDLFGEPKTLSFGVQTVEYKTLTDMGAAIISYILEKHKGAINITSTPKKVPIIQEGYYIPARDLATSRESGSPLDTTLAVQAAVQVGLKEEDLLIQGWDDDGDGTYEIAGVYQAAGLTDATDLAWSTAGNAVKSIANAKGAMKAVNIYPPYNLVIHPNEEADLDVFVTNHIRSQREEVETMLGGGKIFITPDMTAGKGLLMAAPPRPNLYKLIICQDIITKTWPDGPFGLNGHVYEAMIPLIFNSHFGCTMTDIS